VSLVKRRITLIY